MRGSKLAVVMLLFVVICSLPLVRADAKEDISVNFQKSFDLEQKKDYASAFNEVLRILSIEGENYTATLRAGWLSYLKGSHEDSIVHYRKAVSLAPSAIEPRLGLTLPLMALSRWKETEATAREALTYDRMNYLANSRLAYSLYMMGQYGQAAELYSMIVKLYPSDIEMQLGLAWTYLKMGDKKSARDLFSKVLSVRRTNARALEGMEAVQK